MLYCVMLCSCYIVSCCVFLHVYLFVCLLREAETKVRDFMRAYSPIRIVGVGENKSVNYDFIVLTSVIHSRPFMLGVFSLVISSHFSYDISTQYSTPSLWKHSPSTRSSVSIRTLCSPWWGLFISNWCVQYLRLLQGPKKGKTVVNKSVSWAMLSCCCCCEETAGLTVKSQQSPTPSCSFGCRVRDVMNETSTVKMG